MTGQLEVLITFILYLAFFAWVGYRRGSLSEGIVFGIAVGSWFLLQEAGDILVRIVNLGSKFLAFVQAGGLGANPDAAFGALGDAPPWVTAENRQTFLFLVWAALLFLAYIISGPKAAGKKSKSDGWALLLGIMNGLLFAAILLPRLVALIRPTVNEVTGAVEPTDITDLFSVLGGGFTLLGASFTGLWELIDPSQRSFVLLILLTLFLLLAALSLRSSSKPKKTT